MVDELCEAAGDGYGVFGIFPMGGDVPVLLLLLGAYEHALEAYCPA